MISYYNYEDLVSVRFGLYHEADVYYQILNLNILNSSNTNTVISTVCIFSFSLPLLSTYSLLLYFASCFNSISAFLSFFLF